MANEMKAVCGGFLVGEGLTMDGKVLKATGGGSGGAETKVFAIRRLMGAAGYDHAVLLGATKEDIAGKLFVMYKYENGIAMNILCLGLHAEEDGMAVDVLVNVGQPSADDDIFQTTWFVKQENAQGLLLTNDPADL